MGDNCNSPFDCPFSEHCSAGLPASTKYPVTLFPGGAGKKVALELLSEGVADIRNIPDDRLENDKLERIRRITAKGGHELDRRAKKELKALGYPRYYLDFETIGYTVPVCSPVRSAMSKPYRAPSLMAWSTRVVG